VDWSVASAPQCANLSQHFVTQALDFLHFVATLKISVAEPEPHEKFDKKTKI
jgi:hypothetical protein